jgi:ketosteroid isomerase-like protein
MATGPEEVLKDTDHAFSAHAAEHGIRAAFLEYMAEDGLVLRATGAPLEGRAAYAEVTADDPGTATLSWAPAHAVISDDGTLGYTWGYYILSAPDKDGTKKESRGKYLSVWRLQADGAWKFIADIGNIDPSGNSPEPKN